MQLPRALVLGRSVFLLLPLVGAGCVAVGAETALRERAVNERSCTPDKLTVTSLGASAYRVEGCGPPETFICVAYQGWVCTREGGPQSAQRVLQTVGAVVARAEADARDTWQQQQLLQQSILASQLSMQTMMVTPPPPPPPPPPTF